MKRKIGGKEWKTENELPDTVVADGFKIQLEVMARPEGADESTELTPLTVYSPVYNSYDVLKDIDRADAQSVTGFTKQNLSQPLDSIQIKDFPAEMLNDIVLRDIYDYEYFLADERNNKPAARARKTSALKSFFGFLYKRANLIDHNPAEDIEKPTVKRALPKFLTLEESLRLLSSDAFENPERDFCMVTLFLNCGMRLNELVSINLEESYNCNHTCNCSHD